MNSFVFRIFIVDMLRRILSLTYCGAYFVANLLRQIIVSLTISFFVGFRINSSDDKVRFDRVIILNHIHWYVVDLES